MVVWFFCSSMFTYNNKSYNSIAELAKDVNIPYSTLLHRLDRGYTVTNAVKEGKASCRKLLINGVCFESLKDAARVFKINSGTLSSRLNSGWTAEEAVGLIPRKKKPNRTRKTTPVTVREVEYPSLFAAARAYNFSPQLIHKRVKKGLTIEQALELAPFPDWFVPGKGQFGVKQKKKRIEKEKLTGLKKCSVCGKEKSLDNFHISSKNEKTSRCKSCVSGAFLRYRYKISETEFWTILKNQNKECAICKNSLPITEGNIWRPKTVAVDHCHKTNKVRGILCSNCNTGLGMFKDSPRNLQFAIEYLKENHSSN